MRPAAVQIANCVLLELQPIYDPRFRCLRFLVLSGDHSKSSTSCGVSVSFCASPPFLLSSQTCVFPSFRAERNARYLPSGLQRGCDDETSSAVRAIASPPAAGTIQILSSFLSSSRFTVPIAYATHCPSGLICGSCKSRNADTSFTLMARGVVASCCAYQASPSRFTANTTITANPRNKFITAISCYPNR